MNFHVTLRSLYVVTLLLLGNSVFGQNIKKEKMELLSFMTGEWIGTTKLYEEGVITKQGSAYQKITYDLDKNILVIELNTEFLQLHTIIYYDEKDSTYYYYPFSKRGVAKYPAAYKNGQFIVSSSEKNRFVFSKTADGGFQEYGERLVNGKWTRYFQDDFKNTK
ncbi:hypothetical protein M0D21_08180 [Aquimarina sp. D1M17]|uniref:hypothetical protein n=1 Tax=Aquimarina acroporae TaxID=2937283 RepID=UPI0020C11189|nr:hypothetical protein [Aquimarina acroporae]MCK8521542.1 hypothetical protein [Aquimarina acroporae]